MMTTDNKKSLGLYIHIPFCKSKCNYCDFCSVGGADEALKVRYINSLRRQISEWADKCRGYEVDTVYIGGGTPTFLAPETLASLIELCADKYSLAASPEISCECNPATTTAEGLRTLRVGGINRLSIGLQSANNNELRALGRVHSYRDFAKTFEGARRAGFDNISADLMYGIPDQTLESFENTLDELISLSPEHISAYCLKVEENTPFGRLGDALVLPDEDTATEMYLMATRRLASSGYEKYEISNFAKAGRESRHNMRYWLGCDYLGFGSAAHSYFGGERFSYAPNIVSYSRGVFDITDREKIGVDEKMTEYVMLRLRLSVGISLSDFEKRFGKGLFEAYPTLGSYENSGHIVIKDGGCHFTDEGFLVSNYILSDILDF